MMKTVQALTPQQYQQRFGYAHQAHLLLDERMPAAEILQQAGYQHNYDLGGINQWKEQGLPVQ